MKVILRASPIPAMHALRDNLAAPPVDHPRLSGALPAEPSHPGVAPTPMAEPKWEFFEPQVRHSGWFAGVKDVLSGAASERERKARLEFNAAEQAWKAESRTQQRVQQTYRDRLQQYERDIAEYRNRKKELEVGLNVALARSSSHQKHVDEAVQNDVATLDALFTKSRLGAAGIEAFSSHMLSAIPLPIQFPRETEARFDADNSILLLDIQLPNLEKAGLQVQLKTKARPATDKEVRTAQEYVTHALPLRLIHEVFLTPELDGVVMVGVNMHLRYTDRHNGKHMNEIVGSLAATRDEFQVINIAEVDPRLCFRSLKGVSAPSFQDISAVRPILTFDRNDKRIVESREVVDSLSMDTNLAAMDWEDFEHVVRELFSKMFSARSQMAEVHVTRASRDYGVDALIHDPDPIHGGKFVIQAKRYVNTVEVAAVRDLFGTVQNEGANRGYLVTTSSFGPDAHAFARGKPLALIDGTHLLHLLKEHGYSFRINLPEARKILHGR